MSARDIIERIAGLKPTVFAPDDIAENDAPPAASPACTPPAEAGRVLHDFHGEEARRRLRQLYENEKAFRAHNRSWIDAAKALADTHRRRLYQDRYDSFEDYVEQKLERSPRLGWLYVRAADVAIAIDHLDHEISLSAALKLARLKSPQRQADCLAKAMRATNSKQPDAEYLATAVAAELGAKAKRKRKKQPRPKPVRFIDPVGTLSFVPKRADADLVALLRKWLAAELAKRNQNQHRDGHQDPEPSSAQP